MRLTFDRSGHFALRARLTVFAVLLGVLSVAALPTQAESGTFTARDTLAPVPDGSPEAQAMLDAIIWQTGSFEVKLDARGDGDADALAWFASPHPNGDPAQDDVAMLWFAAKDDTGQRIEAPAVLVVHSLHSQMVVGKAIARALRQRGYHAFLVQLPGYGNRRSADGSKPGIVTLEHAEQAVADVRRARDAIAALPDVLPGPIALQGTSLGGFVASVAGAVDGAFDPVVLVLSGADSYHVMTEGKRDAAAVRQWLQRKGYDDTRLRALCARLEPATLAHRLSAARTWLYSARYDTVVPRASSLAMAKAAGLAEQNHIWLPGDHYTAAVMLPVLIEQMVQYMQHSNKAAASSALPPASSP